MADLSITAANVGVNETAAQIQIVQAGEAVTQGQPAYQTAAKYYQADANDTEAKAEALGVFLTPAAIDGYAAIVTRGKVNLGATLAVGETYVVSATKGGIAPIADLTTGDYVTILGVASAADSIDLNIQPSGIQKP